MDTEKKGCEIMMDLKERYMEQAEELAWKIHQKEFHYLTKDQQERVWLMAERDVTDWIVDQADNLGKALKENIK